MIDPNEFLGVVQKWRKEHEGVCVEVTFGLIYERVGIKMYDSSDKRKICTLCLAYSDLENRIDEMSYIGFCLDSMHKELIGCEQDEKHMRTMNRIKRIREEKGITQKELAERLGVDFKIISAYETGYRKLELASFERVCKIADALGCKVSDLFEEGEIKRSLDGN